jgi:hypothetical protein
MELNIGFVVFVLMTCLLQKKNICKTCGIVSCTSLEFCLYKETYHLFRILP